MKTEAMTEIEQERYMGVFGGRKWEMMWLCLTSKMKVKHGSFQNEFKKICHFCDA